MTRPTQDPDQQRLLLDSIRDPARLSTLKRLRLLDTPAEESFDRVARLAARILKAPVALVSLVDANRQYFKSCVGLGEPWSTWRETPLSSSFCKHVVATGEPLVIDDARADPFHCTNEAITNLGAIAYLGCPLSLDDQMLGSMCVIDTSPRHWSEDDVELLRDLTATLLTEIRLRAQTLEREAAIQARDRMLAVVSHDLKTPIQSIVTAIALLDSDELSDEQADLIASLRGSATHMQRLIADLLDVSAIESGPTSIEASRFELQQLLDEVVRELRGRAADKSQHIAIKSQSRPVLLADRDRLTQVLSNILDNAIRFTPAGEGIQISAHEEDGWVFVSIRDSGPGIPDEDLPHIFEWCWHRGRRDNSGTGLGLSIARGIVEAHGGHLWARNHPDGGAVFTFSLAAASKAPADEG